MENAMEYVTLQLREIEEFIKNSEDCYDDLYEQVDQKLNELRVYAKNHEVPLIVDADDLISMHREESSSYEEESSSSYDEEESFDEDEDGEEDENGDGEQDEEL